MDELDIRWNIIPGHKTYGLWETFVTLIPRKIRNHWYWLTPIKRRWVEDYSFGEFTAYYEYST